uniref:C-type lectin domain-containing protein n=1 Tax=Panagrolaimus davidi TaxID=227884 RepID=A0A914QCN9_9BILA
MAPGNWSWTDNTAFDFKDWAPKEPQNLSMNCATVTIQNGLWASSDCFKTKPYVCETITLIPPTTAPVSTTPSYPAYMNCTEGWLYFEPTHSCYGHNGYNSKAGTWTEAEQYCEKQNAHLPSLHSYDEMRFLTSEKYYIKQNLKFKFLATSHFTNDAGLWIGLTSNDNEVTWKWSDGSPVDYLPWGSGYPRLNVSSCVTLFNNRIYDVNCATGYYFICKKPATL